MRKSLVSAACMAGALVLVLAGCSGATEETTSRSAGSASVSESAKEPASSDPTQAPESGPLFENGVLTTPELKIEITDHKVIPAGKKGNEYGKKPVIAFWYKITNLTGKDVSPMDWLFVMRAYQDNNPNAENELNVAALPDDRFLDTQMEKVKQGGTVENAVAYELDDETTPVDLVASEGLGITEIGKVTYNLR